MDFISAGDIEKYSYCPLSWWLSREEHHEDSEGVKKHREIGMQAKKGMKAYQRARNSERTVLYLAIGATIVSLVGISMIYSSYTLGIIFDVISVFWLIAALYFLWKSERYVTMWHDNFKKIMVVLPLAATVFSILSVTFVMEPNKIICYIMEISSLLWLIFATFFFYLALRSEMSYEKIKKELRLPDGEIIYVDDLERSPILKSEKYGIWGRPDLLIKVGEDFIPVEVKTGRVPKGPYFSHIMQLTAYMVLVEENYRAPPYGLLKYGPQVYRIEYEEDLKNLLLEKVSEMRKALKTGEVHRNHNRPGKCKHCSRREICPERLA